MVKLEYNNLTASEGVELRRNYVCHSFLCSFRSIARCCPYISPAILINSALLANYKQEIEQTKMRNIETTAIYFTGSANGEKSGISSLGPRK